MKKNIIAVLLILVIVSSGLFTQSKSGASFFSGGHDSLLFDGSEHPSYFNISKCMVKVERVTGDVEAFVMETKIIETCGRKDTMIEFKKKKVKIGDILVFGDEIKTGPDGKIDIGLPDGSEMRLGPDSKVMIPSNYCDTPSGLKFFFGHMWINIKKLLGSAKYEVKTERAVHGVRGTQFSVETTNDEEIVRVYEGSVQVSPLINSSSKTEDNAKAYAKLTEDYQAGKITMEEFIKKSQEYQENITKVSEDMKSKLCEAGYTVKITDKVSDPVPIESNDDKWFDDAFYTK